MPAPVWAVGFTQHMDNRSNPASFLIFSVTSADVERVIMSLKNNKYSIYVYSNEFSKIISNLVSPILSYLMNMSSSCC